MKKPRKKYLAIPRNVKRTKGGKISKRDLPAAALKKKRTFIGPTKTAGTKGIYQRVGKKRTPIKMLYFLTPRDTDIDERFEFVETAETMALKVYDKEFGKAFAKAIRTAR